MEAIEVETASLDGGFSSLGRVSLLPEGCEESSENPPARALAVSNRFGLTFFATSKGFSAVRTADLVQVSRTSENGDPSICYKCIITVELPGIRLLELSEDSAVLAVCTIDKIRFFHLWSLIEKKDKAPLEVRSLETPLKDFRWSPTEASKYLTLSSEGDFSLSGVSGTSIGKVSAACWSPDGKSIAYAVDLVLNIVSADLVKIRRLELPSQLPEIKDASATAVVDSIHWTSASSMLVSYAPKDDEEEMGCALFWLRGTQGAFSEEAGDCTAHTVPGGFACISSSIISDEYGPYTLTQFLEPWKLAIASYRKAVDDHVILLGCDGSEPVLYDLHDSFRAYIPVVGDYGDENTVTGLAIDRTSSIELPDPRDKSVTLPPCPAVLCSTRDSRVCVFRLIRYDNDAQVVLSPCSLDEIKPQPDVQDKVKDVGQSIAAHVPLNSTINESKPQPDVQDKVKDVGQSVAANVPLSATTDSSANKVRDIGDLSSTAGISIPTNTTPPKTFYTQTDIQNSAGKGIAATTPLKTAFSFSKTANEQVRKAQEESPLVRGSSKPNGMAPSTLPKSDSLSKQLSMPPVSDVSQKQSGMFAGADKQLSRAATVDSVLKPATSRPALTPPSTGNLALQPRRPGMSDMEADFVRQLDKVKRMYDDVDQFMSLIEGKGNSQESSFTRSMVEKLEMHISAISEKCSGLKQNLREHSQLVEELRDQGLQVDAWRIYVESLVEQAGDSRYQDLWFRQKLHPEMDIKRKHVVNADQSLKRQIAELESHLHVLELNERQRAQKKPQVSHNGQFQSFQSLYNTVNAQFEAAEQLSSRLADLMDQLNLPLNAATRKTGLRTDRTNAQPRFSSLQQVLSTPPKSVSFDSPAPDSSMRRRDSMDNAWADLEATKTKIRRATRTKSRAESSQALTTPTELSALRSSILSLSNVVPTQAQRASFSTSQQPAQVPAKPTTLAAQFPAKATTSVTNTSATFQFPARANPFATAQVPAKSSPFASSSVLGKPNAASSDTFTAPSTDLTKQLIFATPLATPSTDAATQANAFVTPLATPSTDAATQANAFATPLATSSTDAATQAPEFAMPKPEGSTSFVADISSSAAALAIQAVKASFSVPDLNESSSAAASEDTDPAIDATSNLPRAAPQGSLSGTSMSSLAGVAAQATEKSVFAASSPPAVVPQTTQAASFGTSTSSSASFDSGVLGTSESGSLASKPSPFGSFAFSSASVSGSTGSVLTSATSSSGSAFVQPMTFAFKQTTQALGSSASSIGSVLATSAASSSGSVALQPMTSGAFAKQATQAAVTSAAGNSSSSTTAVTSSIFGAGTSCSSVSVAPQPVISSAFAKQATQAPALTSSVFGTSTSSSSASQLSTVAANSTFGTSTGSPSVLPSVGNQSMKPNTLGAAQQNVFGTIGSISSSATQAASSFFGTTITSPASQTVASSPFGTISSSPGVATVQQQPVKANVFGSFPQTSPFGTDDDMEEEPSANFSGFGGLGLGSFESSKPNANPFGISASTQQPSPPLSAPTGQLFRPPAFSLPTSQQSPSSSAFSSAFGSGSSAAFSSPFGGSNSSSSSAFSNPFGSSSSSSNPAFSAPFGSSSSSSPGGFGQPSQLGAGQQALGSALGAFGQTRQMGFGASGIGFASPTTGSGFGTFSSAATGGGFGAFSQKPSGFAAAASSATVASTGSTPLFTEMRK